MIDFMAEHSAGRAIVFGGDFNLHRDDPIDAAILESFETEMGLTEACLALDCPEPNLIDRFFYRSGLDVELEPLSWEVEVERFTSEGGIPFSDHFPVVVRFGWSAPP